MAPKKKGFVPLKDEETLTRIAIVNSEKCKPSRCVQECKKGCPVVRMGALLPRCLPPATSARHTLPAPARRPARA